MKKMKHDEKDETPRDNKRNEENPTSLVSNERSVWHSNERKARFFMHVVVCVCLNENLKKTECTKWKMNNILSLNNISVGSLEMFA